MTTATQDHVTTSKLRLSGVSSEKHIRRSEDQTTLLEQDRKWVQASMAVGCDMALDVRSRLILGSLRTAESTKEM